MNICIVNEGFKLGGVERVTIELTNSLYERGHQITLIDFLGKYEFYYNVNPNINKPKIIKPRNFKRKIIGKALKFKSFIFNKSVKIYGQYKEQAEDLINYLETNNFDVLIVNQGKLTALIPTIKKSKFNGKIIAWQHSDYNTYVNNYYKDFLDDYLLGIKMANMVVCLTESDRKKFSLINKNSQMIYNPLSLANNKNKICNLNKKNIIYVGRLKIEPKGLDYLIEIAKNLNSNWKILVAGDGPDRETFVKLIRENNLDDKIILKGALKNEELEKFYISGSIFISTSRWEGFGLSIIEAMSFGLPVISFKNSGPNEILKNGDYGILVEKYNVNEFSNVLNKLTNDAGKRLYFQRKSLQRVKDFNKKVITNNWESTLKILLDTQTIS